MILRYLMLILTFFYFLQNSFANDAVAQASEYAKQAMVELASDPPLILLRNEYGKSRHEILGGYMTLKSEDNATLSNGIVANEVGNAKGFGLSYGYSYSFKEKWAVVTWLQVATVEGGNHTQRVNGQVTAKSINFDSLNLNLAVGLSYEFFRDNDKHTLNVFGGPSLMYLDFHSDVENYAFPPNAVGTLNTSLDFFFSELIPGAFGGFMYEYKYFDDWIVSPYALGVISLGSECQDWEADRVSVNNGNLDGSSPRCTPSGSAARGRIDIAPSFISIGVKFRYKPWNVGFNISSVVRNAILRPDKEDKAEVTGYLFSLTKSWGGY